MKVSKPVSHFKCGVFTLLLLAFAPLVGGAPQSMFRLPPIKGRTYSVGVSKIDITPDYPVRLNGYIGRNAESTNAVGRLYAKAIAIGTDREKPGILICVDNCIVPHGLYDELVARMAKRGIARERL